MIHTERPPCQLNFQTLYCIQLFSGRDGGKRKGVDEQRNYQKEGHHAAGWGVSKFLSLSARERAEQSPGYILPRTTWVPSVQFSASSRLCACRCIFYYPRIKLRRGCCFSCRPRSKRPPSGLLVQAGRSGLGAPARRTVPPATAAAEERGGSRLAQDSYFGG